MLNEHVSFRQSACRPAQLIEDCLQLGRNLLLIHDVGLGVAIFLCLNMLFVLLRALNLVVQIFQPSLLQIRLLVQMSEDIAAVLDLACTGFGLFRCRLRMVGLLRAWLDVRERSVLQIVLESLLKRF